MNKGNSTSQANEHSFEVKVIGPELERLVWHHFASSFASRLKVVTPKHHSITIVLGVDPAAALLSDDANSGSIFVAFSRGDSLFCIGQEVVRVAIHIRDGHVELERAMLAAVQDENYVSPLLARMWELGSELVEASLTHRLDAAGLTRQQVRIAALAATGLDHRGIAARIDRDVATVKWHLTRIYRILGIKGQRQLQAMKCREIA